MPSFMPAFNVTNVRSGDTIGQSDGFVMSRVKANSPYIIWGELRVHPQFKARIAQIIPMRSQEQMFRVYARRIIATMAHTHTFRDRADPPLICKAVRLLVAVINAKRAVSAILCARPFPALVRRTYVDIAQESFKRVCYFTVSHLRSVLSRWLGPLACGNHVGGSFHYSKEEALKIIKGCT